jgi:hypothetical protein
MDVYGLSEHIIKHAVLNFELMHGQRPTKKLKKNPHHTEIVQTKHYIEYRSMAPKNGNNHHIYIYEPVNGQEVNMKPQFDNFEPENIPVVINGCVLATKNSSTIPIKKELSLTKNILNDLYVKLL